MAASIAQGQTLIYGIENEIKDLNMLTSLDKNALSFNELTAQGLYFQRPDGELVPDLAISAERHENEWRVKLSDTAFFSSGKKVTCDDVAANYEQARTGKGTGRIRLQIVTSFKCRGNELVIATKVAAPQLLQRIGYFYRMYDPATLYEKAPRGSGPFQFQKREGKDIVLIPNKFYRGAPPNFQEIRFRALRDPWLRDLALNSGNVDFLLENFSKIRLLSYERNPKLKIYRNPSTLLHYLAFNIQRVPEARRKQLRDAFFSSAIIEKFWGEDAQATQTIFGVEKVATPPAAPPATGSVTLEVTCTATDGQLELLRELAEDLKPKGVVLKIRPLEFATFMKQINSKNFESYLFYVDVSHPQNLEALLSSRGNRLNVDNPKIDEAFAEVAASISPAVMARAQRKLESLNGDGAYVVPLFRPYRVLVVGQRLELKPSPDGFWRDLVKGLK